MLDIVSQWENVNSNHNDLFLQKLKRPSVDVDVGKRELSHTAWGKYKMLQLLWKRVWQFLKQLQNKHTPTT